MTTTITLTMELPDEVVRWLQATTGGSLDDHAASILATAVCDAIGPDLTEGEWQAAQDAQAERVAAEGVIPF